MADRSQQFAAGIGWQSASAFICVHLRFQTSCVPLPHKPGGWSYMVQQTWAVTFSSEEESSC
jgi:hypothetical protein